MDSSGLEEDDDWSRRVERDESQRYSSSGMAMDGEDVSESEAASIPPNGNGTPATQNNNMNMGEPNRLAPQREEPTLKEKLVERERQRRVETEMARLKRQFALSSSHHGDDQDQDDGQEDGNDNDDHDRNANSVNEGVGGAIRAENGSVQTTVGDESSFLGDELDKEGENSSKHTFPMERFLQQQGTVNQEELSQQREQHKRADTSKGVVMERFLKDPIVVEPSEPERRISDPDRGQNNNLDRTVSFDMVPRAEEQSPRVSREASGPDSTVLTSSIASMEVNANASVEVNPSVRNDDSENDDELPHDRPYSTTSSEQPTRVLRLTEAEIQEMAAIEAASIGNAPPSDREDDISESSFVGELQTDIFGAPNHNIVDPMGGAVSQGTAQTTAMDSASMVGSNRSGPPSIDRGHEDHSLDDIDTGSEASSDDGNSVSVVGNPPSERAPSEHERGGGEEGPTSPSIPDEIHPLASPTRNIEDTDSPERLMPPQIPNVPESPLDLAKSQAANAGVVNRQIRPGMLNFKPQPDQRGSRSPASPMRRALSMPDAFSFDVDGFDYDKHAPLSPRSGLSDSVRDFPPDDVWSPSLAHEKMAVSPLHAMRKKRLMLPSASINFSPPPDVVGDMTAGYGTLGGVELQGETPQIQYRPKVIPPSFDSIVQDDEEKKDEGRPLLSHVPREISARRAYIHELLSGEFPIRSLVEDVFSDIRSVSTATESLQNYEAKEYLETNMLARAFPERLVALIVTLIIEIPVMLIVLGGSDRLCMLIGRSKYQLLMGFLPLSSAISGNVGLQSSTLTTRAISHGHVTPSNYRNWLGKEVGAAVCLGFGMGTVSCCIAYWASNFDPVFAFTIMIAQFFSIVTAGVTGTFAPLLFTFIFNRDPGKWGGPLETAIQDIVGSFALVFLSYKILEFFGPLDIDPNDMCGGIESY